MTNTAKNLDALVLTTDRKKLLAALKLLLKIKTHGPNTVTIGVTLSGNLVLSRANRVVTASITLPTDLTSVPFAESCDANLSDLITLVKAADRPNTLIAIQSGSLWLDTHQIPTTPATFVSLPAIDIPNSWSGTDWVDAMTYMTKIVSDKSIRVYGTVVHVDRERMVATDGFRLAYTEAPPNMRGNIPAAALPFLTAIAKKQTIRYGMAADDSAIRLAAGNVDCFVRMYAVSFPRYESVLSPVKQSAEFTRKEIVSALKQVMCMTDKSNAIEIRWNADGMHMYVCENTKTIAGVAPDHTCVLNGQFLLDFLDNVSTNTIVFDFASGAEQPIQVTAGKHTLIIVPIVLNK
jgi:hypothetical protein